MHWEHRIIYKKFRERNLVDGTSTPRETFTLAHVQFDDKGVARNFDVQVELAGAPTLFHLEAQIDDLKEAFSRPMLTPHGNILKEVEKYVR